MAVNILEQSPTYCRLTDKITRRRRDVISAHLKNNYKVTRGTDDTILEKVRAELADEGIEVSKSAYVTDKSALRFVFQWLKADEENKKRLHDKAGSQARSAIDAFIADGITKWNAVCNDQGLPEVTQPEPPPRIKLEELEGGKRVLAHLAGLGDDLSRMLEEDERLKEENARLCTENSELRERLADCNAYHEYADTEVQTLESQVRAMRGTIGMLMEARLEQIAEKYPEHPELMEVARKIKEGQQAYEKRLDELKAKLPNEFAWANDSGEISYDTAFLKALEDFESVEQERIVEQLEVLAIHGLEYASLNTHKIKYRLPNSPLGCFASRGADDIRFTWSKNGQLTVHWLYRKGHSRVMQTER